MSKEGYIYIGNECYCIRNVGGQSEVRKVYPNGYEIMYKGTPDGCRNYIQDQYDNEVEYTF